LAKVEEMKKKFYITTSIAYTNAPPHLGFALELVQADVIARYHRLLDEDVFFLTGTDEHGFKVAEAAEKERKSPEVFVGKISAQFRELTKVLNISNNDFIRTTEERHLLVVREVWKKLREKNDVYLKHYTGWYCKGCEAFITEKTEHEAGPPRCAVHRQRCELIKEKNWFFKLSDYTPDIKRAIENNGQDGINIIPEERKNEILKVLTQEWIDFGDNLAKKTGPIDVSFSRSAEKLRWGIPVPDDNSQTIYVWADALLNYISALGSPESKKFKEFWPPDVQCIGKDILKFHSLIWPAMLLSLRLKLPKNIFVHGFITSADQKMSKSLGNVIDPFELVERYGTDAVRYFLLREIPPTEDGDFTYEKFKQRYNADLANGLGNLFSRTVALSEGVEIVNPKFQKEIERTKDEYKKALDNFKFSESLGFIWDLISFCDKYIDKERPWEKRDNKNEVIGGLLSALGEIAKLLEPFLPGTAKNISEQIKIREIKPLFPRI